MIDYGTAVRLDYTHKVLLRYAELDVFPQFTRRLREILTGQPGRDFLEGTMRKKHIQTLRHLDRHIGIEMNQFDEIGERYPLAERKEVYIMLSGLRLFTDMIHPRGPYPEPYKLWADTLGPVPDLENLRAIRQHLNERTMLLTEIPIPA